MAPHAEVPYLGGVVVAGLLLLGVVPHASRDVDTAAAAPDVVRHLEPDDEDSLVQLASPLAQRMLAAIVVDRALCIYTKIS
jgi:hypothetical protein